MPGIPCRAVLERIETLSYNVRGFRVRLKEPVALEFKAGQFMIVNVPHEGKVVKRAYSIASPPYEPGVVEFCIQKVDGGVASTYFWGLKEGQEMSVNGPHGNFILKEPLDYIPVFMATGTGVAPFRAMIKDLLHRNFTKDMWLLFGCRYEHALLYESEFRSLASMRHNFHFVPTVSRPKDWHGETGHIQQTFPKLIPEVAGKEIYVCGWLQIVKAICADLEQQGVPRAQIHYEEWA